MKLYLRKEKVDAQVRIKLIVEDVNKEQSDKLMSLGLNQRNLEGNGICFRYFFAAEKDEFSKVRKAIIDNHKVVKQDAQFMEIA